MAIMMTNSKKEIIINNYNNLDTLDIFDVRSRKTQVRNILEKEEMIEILDNLMTLGRAYRKLHFFKDDEKYYNIALDEVGSGICDKDGNLDYLFLNKIQHWEQKIMSIQSDLFKLTSGNVNIKFYKMGEKALYVSDVIDKFEEVKSIPFLGELCGEVYSAANKMFKFDYNEAEYIKARTQFDPIWSKGLNELDKVLTKIDMLISFNNGTECEVELSVNERIAV